jgi:hypothetical protein
MKLNASLDIYETKKKNLIRIAGLSWTQSILAQLCDVSVEDKFVSIDMSEIQFIPLFEWVSIVSMLERVLTRPSFREFGIDFFGKDSPEFFSPSELIQYEEKKEEMAGRPILEEQYNFSKRVYNLAGFLESLGTLSILTWPGQQRKVLYPMLSQRDASFRSFYTRPGKEETVVLGLTRINNKGDCRQFLDEKRIINWRNAMDERFRLSSLFDSEEIWRIFCYELAVNIWEHADTTGFIAARVVDPLNGKGKVKTWCKMTYPPLIQTLFRNMRHGFLELCVADSGIGIASTLKNTYMENAQINSSSEIKDEDILAFAFHELGTCKAKNESWATERHALGRILQLVSKYGGALTVRSGYGQISYISTGGRFNRLPNNLGYQPQYSEHLTPQFKGTHLQLILPLVPDISANVVERQSILVSTLPTGFRTQPEHVRGHIVPLLETLDCPDACIGREEQKSFIDACKKLGRKLFFQRPRMEPLVLDFSGLNWTPSQFETMLHLLENILQDRPVLLVEIDSSLAKHMNRPGFSGDLVT